MSTPVTIGGKPFACVRLADADFRDQAAVYVILCVGPGGSWKVLDVGQSGAVGSRIDSHDRKDEWHAHCSSGNIWVCVYPTPTSRFTMDERLKFEASLREQYAPLCGQR
jgi:hypothetical protein